MAGQRFETALSLLNAKEASIYFKHIIPLGIVVEYANSDDTDSVPMLDEIKGNLFPPQYRDEKDFNRLFARAYGNFAAYYVASFAERMGVDALPNMARPLLDRIGTSKQSLRRAFNAMERLMIKFQLHELVVSDANFSTESSSVESSLSIALQRASLIDAKRASWDQIFEFRKDKQAQMKLRRLRVFAFENYAGKPVSFIEDDICKRREDYSNVVAKWGFDTREGAISAVSNSKVIASGGVAAIASAAMGMPLPAVLSTLATGGVELTKLGIYLSKRKFELRQFVKENPFSFIEYAEERLAPPPKDLRQK